MAHTIVDLDPRLSAALAEIKARLTKVFGDRLRKILLYGSQARGDTHEHSDVDLMILLDGPVEFWRDMEHARDAVYDIQLGTGYMLSLHPIEADVFERQEYEVYRAAQEEGIAL